MVSTVVVSIKPFADNQRSELDSDLMQSAIRALLHGTTITTNAPDYTTEPVIATKPHWFKRLYSKVLAKFTLSCRVTVEELVSLRAIPNWQDKIRRAVYKVSEVLQQTVTQKEPKVYTEDVLQENADKIYDIVKSKIEKRFSGDKQNLEKLLDTFYWEYDLKFIDVECYGTPEEFLRFTKQHKERLLAHHGPSPIVTYYVYLMGAVKQVYGIS